MRLFLVLLILFASIAFLSFQIDDKPVPIPASKQQVGNAVKV